MKFLKRLNPRHGVAIIAGLLLAVSFPEPGVAGFAWLSPGLILFAALGQRGKDSFRIGYLAGLTHYLFSLRWLLCIPFPAGAIVGWVALSAYLALYPATWVWLCWRLFDRKHSVAVQGYRTASEEFLKKHWWQRAGWTLLCAALWVALEMVVARFLSGFPWNLLGNSQYRLVPLIQIASVTGVYGVSFLMVWFSVSLMVALVKVVRQPTQRWAWLMELRLVLIALMGVMVFGISRLLERADIDRELKVALVQPGIPQVLIWDHTRDADRFNTIMELSRLALAAKPDLLIWPESSMPNLTEDNFRAITNLVALHQVWMVLGADDAEPRNDSSRPNDYDDFNAAFLFDPQGRYAATYRKQHLVVFGEYLPFARRLPFLRKLIPIPADFTPGRGPVPFELDPVRAIGGVSEGDAMQRSSKSGSEISAKLSVLICFEDVVPGLARQSADDDIDFLLNLTNDGWFGRGAAQWQQAASAVFRAVENGLPVVRCTNTGLTCWIDSRGLLRQILRSESGDVYAPGFMIARIPLLPAGKNREPTFYHRHGDWFGWGCVVLSAFSVGLSLRKWPAS